MAASPRRELLNAPLAEFLSRMLLSVAEAHIACGAVPIAAASDIPVTNGCTPDRRPQPPDPISGPYELTEVEIDVAVAITMARSARSDWKPFAAPVNASYVGRYGYDARGSSRIRCRVKLGDAAVDTGKSGGDG